MAFAILFSPEARDDLRQLYLYIADRSGPITAIGYIERIEAYCRSFADFPDRGLKRDDLAPGLRVIGFERRVAIAFHIDEGSVVFDRILYGGRTLPTPPEKA
ncbi:MAG: type II toxin-antitoxin system RelE/ParE family toxin [Bosea sp.]|nr:type II toxin-antitoxin system RelE/ParE family toxin [Bosea sp. (in: a-proteobacteria)]